MKKTEYGYWSTLGIFNAFMANYKAAISKGPVDGLADRTLAFGVATYGFICIW